MDACASLMPGGAPSHARRCDRARPRTASHATCCTGVGRQQSAVPGAARIVRGMQGQQGAGPGHAHAHLPWHPLPQRPQLRRQPARQVRLPHLKPPHQAQHPRARQLQRRVQAQHLQRGTGGTSDGAAHVAGYVRCTRTLAPHTAPSCVLCAAPSTQARSPPPPHLRPQFRGPRSRCSVLGARHTAQQLRSSRDLLGPGCQLRPRKVACRHAGTQARAVGRTRASQTALGLWGARVMAQAGEHHPPKASNGSMMSRPSARWLSSLLPAAARSSAHTSSSCCEHAARPEVDGMLPSAEPPAAPAAGPRAASPEVVLPCSTPSLLSQGSALSARTCGGSAPRAQLQGAHRTRALAARSASLRAHALEHHTAPHLHKRRVGQQGASAQRALEGQLQCHTARLQGRQHLHAHAAALLAQAPCAGRGATAQAVRLQLTCCTWVCCAGAKLETPRRCSRARRPGTASGLRSAC